MEFVKIANYNNKLTAETSAHLLDEQDIPYQIHSDEGFFGEGGVSPYVFLSVPAEREAEAREILDAVSPNE